MAAPPPDDFGDLLLDVDPSLGLLDDLQLDCDLPPGLGGLGGLDDLGGGGADGLPASSDLLESLQLDAFSLPVSSTGAGGQPSGSGTESPVVLPLVGVPGGAATAAHLAAQLRGSCDGTGASPATSESEARGQGEQQQQRGRSGSPATGATAAGEGRYASEDEKRLARMQRNRENAQLSRQRKKAQMADLQARCTALTQHNAQLSGAVQRLTAENAQLRQQLALVCQQAAKGTAAKGPAAKGPAAKGPATGKGPVNTAGAAAKAQSAAGPAAARPAAAGAAPPATGTATATAAAAAAAAGARGLLPQWPLLPFGFQLPHVTLPLAQRPGSAPAVAAPVQPKAAARPAAQPAAAAQPARASKRARTVGGASTAFLALFSLFMIAGLGPMAPGAAPHSGASPSLAVAGGSRRTLQALPDPAALHNEGRSLQALPAAAEVLPHSPLLGAAPVAADLSGSGHMQQLLNSTLQALLLEPGNAAVEAAALARLQELGPVALLLDADDVRGGPGANPLAASSAFPGLAGQLFGAAGLEVPQMCRPVLEFDAASVPHAARSRRSLERYVLGATGFRGRSLAVGSGGDGATSAAAGPDAGAPALRREQPAPAPALRIVEEEQEQEEEALLHDDVGGGSGSQALLPEGGPVLVSVLLPANASGGGNSSQPGGAKLAAADKVFVVLLHPQDKYVAYSCSLPRPVAVL